MFFKQIKMHGDNLSYIVADENTKEAAVIDPGFDSDDIETIINQENLKLLYIINTHDHIDHIAGEDDLKLRFGAKNVSHRLSSTSTDERVDEGEVLHVGNIEVKVFYTPGHTLDSVCLLVNGKKLITGDTLLVGSVGTTPIADGGLRSLYESLTDKIMKLPDDVELYPGHERDGRASSTIGEEKRTNRALQARDYEEFVELVSPKVQSE